MNWKTRQLFSDREHGIVSGLSPVNMMGGGTVPIPGYKTGGGVEYAPTAQSIPVSAYNREEGSAFINTGQTEEPSIEQQVAALAAQQGISVPEARAMLLNQMVQEKGLTLSGEVINQFATGVITLQDALAQAVGPPKMQAGGLALDLFEEGDQEINEPLNMMAQAVSPSLSDITPAAPTEIGEAVGEETALMDQGFGEYQVELQSLKETFKDEIRSYVAQAGTTDLEKYLQRMDVVYNNQLNKLKSKHGITEALPEDILLTEDFIAELVGSSEAEIPGFEEGGEVNLTQPQLDALFGKGRMPLEDWSKYSPKQKNIWLMKAQIARIEQDRTSATGLDMTELNRLIKERRGLAGEIGEVARSGYSSVQDPVSHFFSARKAGKTAELAAREKMIADEIALQQALLTSQSRSGGVGGLDFDFSAKESEALTIGDLIQDQKEKESLDKAWANIYKPNTYGDLPKFGKTLRDFVRGFGRRFPSGLTTNVRVYKNHVTGEDWQSTLPEYYDLVMKKASEIEDRKDREKYIEEELDKWPLLPLFTLEE
jgi:hypothetical protein